MMPIKKTRATHRPPPASGAPLALSEWKPPPPPPRPLNAGLPPPPRPRPPRPPPPPPIGRWKKGGREERKRRKKNKNEKKNSKKIDLCQGVVHSLLAFLFKGRKREPFASLFRVAGAAPSRDWRGACSSPPQLDGRRDAKQQQH